MKAKMIVTDLDGTLLRGDKTVSEYTASVFNRCRDAGMKIVFATARPVRAVDKLLKLDIKSDACIYHNGAVIEIGGKPYKEVGIEYEATVKLLESVKRFDGMKISAEINDKLYTNYDSSDIWRGVEFTLTDFTDLPKIPADKIIIETVDKTDIKNIEALLGDNLYWEVSENKILMIMNKRARKLNAVKDVAGYYGLSLPEVIAFGDDFNDVEMLRECGAGVAVANAVPEAKSAAKFTCGGCDEDGAARWLENNWSDINA